MITIRNVELAEPAMLHDVITNMARHVSENVVTIEIIVSPRVPADAPAYKHPGWCEYLCHIRYANQGRLTIGAIQRQDGAATEFHS
jgi:hypothetical protein